MITVLPGQVVTDAEQNEVLEVQLRFPVSKDTAALIRKWRHDFKGCLTTFELAFNQFEKSAETDRDKAKVAQLIKLRDDLIAVKQASFDQVFSESLIHQIDSASQD